MVAPLEGIQFCSLRAITAEVRLFEQSSDRHNGRAADKDGITGEYLKYGAPVLYTPIAHMFNQMFSTQVSIEALLTFIIIPLNKNGKQPVAEHTRPISL